VRTSGSNGERLRWWILEAFLKLIMNNSTKWWQTKEQILTNGVLDSDKIIEAWREAVPTTQSMGD
jgi:hypothetical protein